jgi:hypothetical protein
LNVYEAVSQINISPAQGKSHFLFTRENSSALVLISQAINESPEANGCEESSLRASNVRSMDLLANR